MLISHCPETLFGMAKGGGVKMFETRGSGTKM